MAASGCGPVPRGATPDVQHSAMTFDSVAGVVLLVVAAVATGLVAAVLLIAALTWVGYHYDDK
jgi:hypothetical protein